MAAKVFIDANKFLQFGKNFDKSEALVLRELVDAELIRVVTTDLTIIEIAKRWAKKDLEALEPLFKDDFKGRAEEHLGIKLPALTREEVWQKIFGEYHKRLKQKFIVEFKTKPLSINDVPPLSVLNDYTHGKGVFSDSSKKDQFPDAFIFAAVASVASEDQPIAFITADKDFSKAIDQADHITELNSFQELMAHLNIAEVSEADKEILDGFLDEFEVKTSEELVQYIVHAEDVEDAELEILEVYDHEIKIETAYRVTSEDNSFLLYGHVTCKARVAFSHWDWDNAIWDSEDKRLVPWGEKVSGVRVVEIEDIPFAYAIEVTADKSSCEVLSASVRGNGYITAELYGGMFD